MSNSIKIPVLISADGQESSGEVTLINFDSKERTMRALKMLGLCWGAALLCVFIPLAHFVLVPLLFLAGLIVPYLTYSKESLIDGGSGNCPKCKAILPIEKGSNTWPLRDLCTECKCNVVIVKKTNIPNLQP